VIEMTPLAHAGHWYHAILYLAPVVLVVVALWLSSLRERRAERDAEQDRQS
jgi:cytochrome c-type biogenesis protein CcmH/NrfF